MRYKQITLSKLDTLVYQRRSLCSRVRSFFSRFILSILKRAISISDFVKLFFFSSLRRSFAFCFFLCFLDLCLSSKATEIGSSCFLDSSCFDTFSTKRGVGRAYQGYQRYLNQQDITKLTLDSFKP